MLCPAVVSMVTDRSAPIRERDGTQSLTYFKVEADLQLLIFMRTKFSVWGWR